MSATHESSAAAGTQAAAADERDAHARDSRDYTDEDQTIFEALSRDHRTIAGLFDQLEAEGPDDPEQARALFRVLKAEFLTHAWAEEEVFYERLAESEDDEIAAAVEALREEHSAAEALLSTIEGMDPQSPRWPERIVEARTLIERHVDKEEKEIFELAAGVLDADEQRELAHELHGAREQVTAETSPVLDERARVEAPAFPRGPAGPSGRHGLEGGAERDVEGRGHVGGSDLDADVEGLRVGATRDAADAERDVGEVSGSSLGSGDSLDEDSPERGMDDVDLPERGPNRPIE